jgi:hypothetical protein
MVSGTGTVPRVGKGWIADLRQSLDERLGRADFRHSRDDDLSAGIGPNSGQFGGGEGGRY